MTKVIMLTDTGRKVDLFSDNTPLREVLRQFQEKGAGTANGEPVLQEDLVKPVCMLARDAEVTLTSFPEEGFENAESGMETVPFLMGKTLAEAKEALLKAKKAVETALKALEDEELPF